jgi:hypothetical protein
MYLLSGTVSCLEAQSEDVVCDTLILTDKRVISVIIDSSGNNALWYHLCDDTSTRPRMMPYEYIREVRSSRLPENGDPGAFRSATARKEFLQGKRSWTFSKPKRRDITLRAGMRVVVTALEHGRMTKFRGTFIELDSLHLILKTTRGEILHLDRIAVHKMKVPRKGAGGMVGMGFILLLLSLALATVAFMLLIVSLLLFIDPQPLIKDNLGNGGCLLPILGLIAGIGLFVASQPHLLEAPFGGPWTVVENLPPTEVLDEPNERLPEP